MKKLRKIILWTLLIGIPAFILASVFLLADLRTAEIKKGTQSEENIQLAHKLLSDAIVKQGLDKMSQFSTYEVTATDEWQGFLGKVGNPWGFNKDAIAMRFTVGDFDSQSEVLEGEQKGAIKGIQSWDYYEKVGDTYETEVADDKGMVFVLAAFHYLFELGNRLAKAPFIRYAGQGQLKGKAMDKVFVSWSSECTYKYDHYIVWIGQESGLIEAATFTTRDNPAPAPVFLYGSLRLDDFREVNGVLIPFKQTAHMGEPKETTTEFIHQLVIQKFEWDSFDASDIRPFADLTPIGDDKLSN